MFSKDNKKIKVYLASGWFNEAQKKQMDEVYSALTKLEAQGRVEFFSPFYDGIVLKKDDENIKKKMGIVWWLNIETIKSCDVIIVCTQDHDVGTIFEAGFAAANDKLILCYNSNKELGLNIMLSQIAKGFLREKEDINDSLHKYWQTPEEERRDFIFNEFEGTPI